MKSLNFILLLLLFSVGSITAQELSISGKVIDAASKEPMVGANVHLKNDYTSGTVVDVDGNYTLKAKKGDIIVFSFVGMDTKEVVVGNNPIINVEMQSQAALDEVVVVGYGTVKKQNLTGAVGQLKGDDLVKGNPISLSQGLQGKMAGVMVNQNDGAPGAGVSIQVRGANSMVLIRSLFMW